MIADYVPDIVLNASNCNIQCNKNDSCHLLELIILYMASHQSSYSPLSAITTSILQIWKQGLREVKRFVQGYTVKVTEWESEPRAIGLQRLLVSVLYC